MKRVLLLVSLIMGSISTSWADDENVDNQSLLVYTVVNNQELSVKCASNSVDKIVGVLAIPETAVVDGKSYPVTQIADLAFSGCRYMTGLQIPKTVYKIGGSPLQYCETLGRVDVSENNPYIKSEDGVVFSKSGKTILLYPPAKVGTEYVIPEGVDTIGGAFATLTHQVGITIPKSVMVLQRGAFYSPKITALTIKTHFPPIIHSLSIYYTPTDFPTLYVPTGALENYQNADGWKDLTQKIEMVEKDMDDVDDNPFEFTLLKDGTASVKAKNQNVCGKIFIPSSTVIDGITYPVTEIAGFSKRKITEVVIPASVTTLKSSAFSGCTSIRSITSCHYYPIDFDRYYYCFDDENFGKATLYVPIGTKTFYQGSEGWCNFLNIEEKEIEETDGNPFEYAVINDSEVSVKARHTRLMGKVEIPSQVEIDGKTYQVNQIANSGFSQCRKLQEVSIPPTLQFIDSWAFKDCEKLESLTVDGESNWFKSVDGVLFTRSGKSLLRFPPGKAADEYVIPETVDSVCTEAFWQNASLKSIVVPQSVGTIQSYAFNGCSSLTALTMRIFYPPQITSSVFGNNLYNVTVNVPTGAQSVYKNVDVWRFMSIQEVDMDGIDSNPLEFTIIGENSVSAKAKCQTVSGNVEIPDSTEIDGKSYPVTQIGWMTTGVTGITIPAHARYIETASLKRCKNLTSVTVRQFYPLGISGDTFDNGVYSNAVLYVPTGSKEIYQAAHNWNQFANIQEQDMDGIDTSALNFAVLNDNEASVSARSSLINGRVEIPETVVIGGKTYTVTQIANQGFEGCHLVTEISISKTLVSGAEYIKNCSSLAKFTVAESNPVYKSIDGVLYSYDGKSLLKYPSGRAADEYTIPEGVSHIKSFSENTHIKRITIPSTIESLESGLLADCDSLSSLIIRHYYPLSVNGSTFTKENYQNVTLYVPVGSLGFYQNTDHWKDFKNILETNMEDIDTSPFIFTIKNEKEVSVKARNKLLTGLLEIPETVVIEGKEYSVTTIPPGAFYENIHLTGVRFPKSVTTIYTTSFAGCDSLESFYVDEGNPVFASIEGILYSSDGKSLSNYPYGRAVEEYTVPDGVETISIRDNKHLQKITIPSSVYRIWELKECSSLSEMVINSYYPLTVTSSTFSEEIFQNVTLYIPKGSAVNYQSADIWRSFKYIQEIDMESVDTDPLDYTILSEDEVSVLKAKRTTISGKITIPQSVVIGGKAYSVTKITNDAFYNCTEITEIVVPKTVTIIPRCSSCVKLERITVEEGNANYKSIDGVLYNSKGNILYYYPNGRTAEEYIVPEGVDTIGYGSLDNVWLKSVILPETVKSIDMAFYWCKNLETIIIPSSVRSISENAFGGCYNLSSVTVKNPSPVVILRNVFTENTYKNATLYVPQGRLGYYKEAIYWRDFVHMEEKNMPDVEISDSPFANVGENQIIMGYYRSDEYVTDKKSAWGGLTAGTWKACVGFSEDNIEAFVGNQIKYVRFALVDSDITDVNVWISSSRDGIPLYTQAVNPVATGWNEVKLDKPYDITGDSIFIGISYHQDGENYPISCVYSQTSEGAGYLNTPGHGWYNMKSDGCLSIQCLVEGERIPQYNLHACVVSFGVRRMGEMYFNVNDEDSNYCQLILDNWGKRAIDQYTVRCEIDGTYVKTVTGRPISGSGNALDYNMQVCGITGCMPNDLHAGRHIVSLAIESINGETPMFGNDDKVSREFMSYVHNVGRQKLLMDYFTATWCPFTPFYDRLNFGSSDKIAVVKSHSGDQLSCEASEAYCGFTMRYPFWLYDRYLDDNLGEENAWEIPSFATVNISASYAPTTRELHIKVTGMKNEDFDALIGNANLTVLLTEDGVVARQREDGKGYIDDYIHNDVLRTNVSEIWGDPVVWDGDKYEMNYSIKLDKSWVARNMNIVAFLGKPFTGDNYSELHVVNCNDFALRTIISNTAKLGDVNGDGVVNASDIVDLVNHIKGNTSENFNMDAADIDGDGKVQEADVEGIVKIIMSSK